MTRITRRTPAPISGRLSEVLNRRRNTVVGNAAARREVQRTAGGQVAVMPENMDPVVSSILARVAWEPRALRGGQYVHVSDLLTKCMRRFAIIERHKIQATPQRLGLMDIVTFAVGDTIHDVIKQRAALGSPTQVWGNWSCKCGTMRTSKPCTRSELAEEKCSACRTDYIEYHEVPMHDDELMVVGTPDLLFYLADFDAFFVAELKSIAHDKWVELTRAVPDHVIQVLMYWYLMKKKGYRVTNKCSILYVTKGYVWGGSPCKEFTFNPEEVLARLDPYLEEAAALKASRENGPLPARTTCGSESAPAAKKCDVCSICFGNSNAAPKTIDIATALRSTRAPVRRAR